MLNNNGGMDRSSLVNFGLFTLVLLAFVIYFQSKQAKNQEVAQTQTQTQTQKATTKPAVSKLEAATLSDSTLVAKTVQLKNKLLTIDFSTVGGQISMVQLNEFKAFRLPGQKPEKVQLFKNNNAHYGFQFKDKSGNLINTKDLMFTSAVNGNQVTMQSKIGTAVIQFIYTLTDKYTVDFNIRTTGLSQVITGDKAQFVWNYKLRGLEKGRSQEEYHSEFRYAFNNYKDYDYDAQGKMDEPKETLNWVAIKQQFFAAVIEPQSGFTHSFGKQDVEKDGPYLKDFNFDGTIQLSGNELNQNFKWYFLPMDLHLLKSYQGKDFDKIISFGWSFIGGVNRAFFVPVFNWLSSLGIAAGWVIFWLTIAVKIVLSPVMYKQYKMSAMMRVIRPEIEEAHKKLKDADNVKRQQATMEIYRKAGINQFAGCIPGLLQAPLFYALFRFFPNMLPLRGVGFWFVNDLTAYDDVIKIPQGIPFLDGHISIFALACTVAILAYTLLSGNMSAQPKQPGMPNMKVMMYIFPVFFFFFLNNYASGLSWYYFVSNTINIVIIFVIKYVILDEKKIHAQIQANKAKPKKVGKFQARMQAMMAQAQEQQKKAEALKKQGKGR